MTENQNPEQKARDTIDALLTQAGWAVQYSQTLRETLNKYRHEAETVQTCPNY